MCSIQVYTIFAMLYFWIMCGMHPYACKPEVEIFLVILVGLWIQVVYFSHFCTFYILKFFLFLLFLFWTLYVLLHVIFLSLFFVFKVIGLLPVIIKILPLKVNIKLIQSTIFFTIYFTPVSNKDIAHRVVMFP